MNEKQAVAGPAKKHKILRRLIFVVILIGIIAVGTYPKKARDLAYKAYATVASKELLHFNRVRDENAPSFLAVVNKMKASGLETDVDEFSVNQVDETDFKYQWRRDERSKKFEVYKDHRGNWQVQETND